MSSWDVWIGTERLHKIAGSLVKKATLKGGSPHQKIGLCGCAGGHHLRRERASLVLFAQPVIPQPKQVEHAYVARLGRAEGFQTADSLRHLARIELASG